ncbi:MAG: hypothetical protein RIC55_00235 [Pirellulaceae bacterium]
MKRFLFALLLAVGGVAVSGCATCQNCDDYSYPAFGGVWQRSDPTHGRVGSAFAPAGGVVESSVMPGDEIEGELVPTPMMQPMAY